jgi:hypothetical protein
MMSFESYLPGNVQDSRWAPIYFEPIPMSGERIAIALIATRSDGEFKCVSLINPKQLGTLFKAANNYVKNVLSLVIESCASHCANSNTLEDWQVPISGVYLGVVNEAKSASLDDLVMHASPMTSFLDHPPVEHDTNIKPREVNWAKSVADIVLLSNARYKQNLNVSLFLGNHEMPAIFTFYSPDLAASLVPITHNKLKQKVEEARAKLWSLDMLSDAPNFLFKPSRRELLAACEPNEQDSKKNLIFEAVEELRDEASRRGVELADVSSPADAAGHILSAVTAA